MTEQNKAGYRPSAQEPYMGPAQLAWFRDRLEAMRHDILGETRRTLSLLRVGAADRTGDEADRARHETECSLSFLAQGMQMVFLCAFVIEHHTLVPHFTQCVRIESLMWSSSSPTQTTTISSAGSSIRS